jgi:hypothetical protein
MVSGLKIRVQLLLVISVEWKLKTINKQMFSIQRSV